MQVVQFRGDNSIFLHHAPGEPSLNALDLVSPELQLDLRTLLFDAFALNEKQLKQTSWRNGGAPKAIQLEVAPLGPDKPRPHYCHVLFQELYAPNIEIARENVCPLPTVDNEVTALQTELGIVRRHLQSIIEGQEGTNEELQSANEEILSSNEELQSINEELETAKEELQSTNEELQNRNGELSLANDDLANLLSSVNIPIVMLGPDLRIRRFTPQAEKMLSLIHSDIGRPIGDIRPKFEVGDLEHAILEVMDTVTVKELEVRDREGRWYSLRLRPYRTLENKIDGAVIVIFDIDLLKKAIEATYEVVEAMFSSTPVSMLALTSALQVVKANEHFYRIFQTEPNRTINQFIYNLGNGEWNIPELKDLLNKILSKTATLEKFHVTHIFEDPCRQTMRLTGRKIVLGMDKEPLIFLTIEPASIP